MEYMTPHDFNTEGNFTTHVDISVAGMVQDCAECHVGGGAMEYVPNPDINARISLRDISTTNVNGFGPITGVNYTAFNKFIDVYDVDNDGDQLEVLNMNWLRTGVMEMDCFLCHLQGYDYGARMEMLREAKFDASRAVGAGVAAPNNNVAWGTDGYGTQVVYNDLVVDDGGGNAAFSDTILMSIKAAPPNDNCAFCHANIPGVDWKKRGDNWKKDMDAHWLLGCMGCHEAKVGSAIGTSGDVSSSDLGQCDPARGNAPYSSVWKPTKNTVKTCNDCHLRAGYDSGLSTYSPDYGAPDPTGKHQAYGLLGKICQDGTDGNMTIHSASHLDIIDCAACHVRKISDEAWNTGGAVVDTSGPDEEGRLTDHANHYVYRDMKENLCYQWQGGKVIPTSVLTTLFWRDIDPLVDINNDGQFEKMDPPLMTDVLRIDIDNGWTNMAEDNAGVIDSVVIQDRIDALVDDLGGNIKLCALAVPFKVTHNVSPAIYALGHACSDCHGASAGIFNGAYELQGKNMDLSYDHTTQVTKFSAISGVTTDFHPNLKNKMVTKSIACAPFSGGSDNLTAIDRSEILYDSDLNGTIIGVDGTTRNTRTEWVTYLNTITEPTRSWPDAEIGVSGADGPSYPHGYGVGCNATTGVNCVTVWDMYDVTIFNSLTFTADDVGDGATYMWNFNDGTGSATGISVSHTFKTLGVYKVVLTVVDAWGIVDPQMIMVNVKRP